MFDSPVAQTQDILTPFGFYSVTQTNETILYCHVIAVDPLIHRLNWARPCTPRVRSIHCGQHWYLYPSLPSNTLSSEHKAHLIGWASLCLPGPQPNVKHQTLCDVLTFPLSFIPVPLILSLTVHRCLLLSAKTLLLLYTPAAPQRFLPYQVTLGLKASCQTWYETWPLLGDLSPPHTPCCTQGL